MQGIVPDKSNLDDGDTMVPISVAFGHEARGAGSHLARPHLMPGTLLCPAESLGQGMSMSGDVHSDRLITWSVHQWWAEPILLSIDESRFADACCPVPCPSTLAIAKQCRNGCWLRRMGAAGERGRLGLGEEVLPYG